MKKNDKQLEKWSGHMRDEARVWVASGDLYPCIVGTIKAIMDYSDFSAPQKIARIRVVLDAVNQARAELSESSITQQGGVDHDSMCHVNLSNLP